MVLIGHSMGGLISRLITYESGDAYWRTVSDTPFELVQAPPEVKQHIQRVYFFQPEASVRRVITIGSPYRGSSYASDALRLLGRRFISLPVTTVAAARQLLSLNPDVFRSDWAPVGLTSLDGLSPDNPILQTMLATPRPPWVRYHNVVGAIKDLPVEQNTDGVVTYASAHREDVESEVVVAAEHSQLHRHPRTILEIRRILLEHLEQLREDPSSGVVPAGR
jgi:hypothetical protein